MSRRRKVNPLRLVLIILIGIALCVVAFFGIKLIINSVKDNSKQKENTPSQEINPSSNEETTISVEDYSVYIDDDEDLGFNFVVAKLKFTTTKDSLYYDLSNLTNSEREIKISEIDGYIDKLESLNYDLSSIALSKEIKSNTNTLEANILIPFINKNGVLNIYNGEKLSFDLSKNVKNASSLKPINHPDQTVIKTNDYDVSVSAAYLSTMMTHNDQEYDASGINVYTYKIIVNNVSGNVHIEDAIFIKENSTVEYHALNNEYQSLKVDNIINQSLKAGQEGGLFFELYKNNDEAINYNGVLRIKFSDNENWVEIPTTIK